MAYLHFPMVETRINKGGVSLSGGLRPFVVFWQPFHLAGQNFEEILQHLKKNTKRFCSSLNVMVDYLCVQRGLECVLERQRAILDDRCHHKVVWQR